MSTITKITKPDSRYPFTYACDLIRCMGGATKDGTKLSRSNASEIRATIAEVLNMDDILLANKLADYYLANQERIDNYALMLFNQAQETQK